MYCGEDVCLSHVGDFRRECISRTANTAGARLFYFGKKKYTSQAVCSSAMQMQNAWYFSVWADSLCCESFAWQVNHVCDISLSEREERQRKMLFIFHLLLLHHYGNALGLQAPVTEAARCFSEMSCAVLSWQVVSGCAQTSITHSWWSTRWISLVLCFYLHKSLHTLLMYHDNMPVQSWGTDRLLSVFGCKSSIVDSYLIALH